MSKNRNVSLALALALSASALAPQSAFGKRLLHDPAPVVGTAGLTRRGSGANARITATARCSSATVFNCDIGSVDCG